MTQDFSWKEIDTWVSRRETDRYHAPYPFPAGSSFHRLTNRLTRCLWQVDQRLYPYVCYVTMMSLKRLRANVRMSSALNRYKATPTPTTRHIARFIYSFICLLHVVPAVSMVACEVQQVRISYRYWLRLSIHDLVATFLHENKPWN